MTNSTPTTALCMPPSIRAHTCQWLALHFCDSTHDFLRTNLQKSCLYEDPFNASDDYVGHKGESFNVSLTTGASLCYAHGMAPPRRASSVSTRIVGFRLTEEETRRLDQVVQDLGHKDRSSLLRAWLAQSGPVPRMADNASSHSAPAKIKKAAANGQQRAGKIETADSNPANDSLKQTAQSNSRDVNDLIGMLRVVIEREKDPRTGWSPIPKVVRALLPHFTRTQIRGVMGILCVIGTLDLQPGDRERLSSEDEALCLCDVQGTAWTRVRLVGKE